MIRLRHVRSSSRAVVAAATIVVAATIAATLAACRRDADPATERPSETPSETPSESGGAETARIEAPRRASDAIESIPTAAVVGFGAHGYPAPDAAVAVGDRRCGACHLDEYRASRESRMARTAARVTLESRERWFGAERLERPTQWPSGQATAAPRYVRDDEGVVCEVRDASGDWQRVRVAAVFGSGERGYTPIALEDGPGVRELRVTYFEQEARWRLTPGAEGDPDPLGYVRSPEFSNDCLVCHMTVIRERDGKLDLAECVFGIGCERCHGPGSVHVDAATRGDASDESAHGGVFDPGKLAAADGVRFCGQCHRRPEDIEPERAFRRTPDLARHAGASLMLSACFVRSPPESTITCLDCHDPHRPIDAARDEFNRACARCHAEPERSHTSDLGELASDCVMCHMPRETRAFFGLSFTSHWIRVPDAPEPSGQEVDEIAAVLEREYREATARPGVGRERQAKLRMRLGKLLLGRGSTDEGLATLRGALEFAPLYKDRLLAASHHERAGEKDRAGAILAEAIRSAPENNRAYHDLARLQTAVGDVAGAQRTLDQWRVARPDDPYLKREQQALDAARGRTDGR